MKKWLSIAIIVALALLFTGYMIGQWGTSIDFEDEVLNSKQDQLAILQDRSTITLTTTSKEGILSVVGLVLVVDKDNSDEGPRKFDSTNALVEFRPTRDLLRLDPVNKVLYEGKVSRKLSGGGSYTAFATELTEEQAAQVLIKDDFYVGYKENTAIPFDKLRQIPRELGKTYLFIDSATLTSITYKTFNKSKSKSTISGTAFGANGNIYVSTGEFAYDAKLSVDPWDISLLTPGTGGVADDDKERQRLIRKQVGDGLDQGETATLLDLLQRFSRDKVTPLKGATLDLTR